MREFGLRKYVLVAISLCCCSPLWAAPGGASLSLNFNSGEMDDFGSGLVEGAAGPFGTVNWNNLEGETETFGPDVMIDTDGVTSASQALVTWSSNNLWASDGRGGEDLNDADQDPSDVGTRTKGGITGIPNDRALMLGYLDTGAEAPLIIDVTELDPVFLENGYDVYVYMLGGVNGRGGEYILGDQTIESAFSEFPFVPEVGDPGVVDKKFHQDVFPDEDGANGPDFVWDGSWNEYMGDRDTAADPAQPGQYIKFEDVTLESFRLLGQPTVGAIGSPDGSMGTRRAPVNAIEIVVAGLEPGGGPVDKPGTVLGVGTDSLLGNDLTDLGNDGVEEDYAPPNLGGFDAEFFSSDEEGFGGGEFAFNVFDNTLGPGNDKWCCGTAFPQIVGADLGTPVELTHFTVSSANDIPDRDPRVWSIEGSNDGENWTTIFSQNDPDAALWDERLQVIRFDAGTDFEAPGEAFSQYRMVTDATGATSGAFFQIGEIELFGSGGQLCGDFDGDGDVDVADRTIQVQNWTGALAAGEGTATFEQGDCDGDGDVDTADQTGLIQNWTGALAGNVDETGSADLIYNPADGNVTLDASSTTSGVLISFVLGTDQDNMRPENFVTSDNGSAGPFIDVGTNTDAKTFQIGQTDPINQGAGPTIDLGNIFPAGIANVEALAEYLTLAEYASELGSGGTFDLKFVPEPSGLALALFGMFGLAMRRRRK